MCQALSLKSYNSHDIFGKDGKIYRIVYAQKLYITILQIEFRAVVRELECHGST